MNIQQTSLPTKCSALSHPWTKGILWPPMRSFISLLWNIFIVVAIPFACFLGPATWVWNKTLLSPGFLIIETVSSSWPFPGFLFCLVFYQVCLIHITSLPHVIWVYNDLPCTFSLFSLIAVIKNLVLNNSIVTHSWREAENTMVNSCAWKCLLTSPALLSFSFKWERRARWVVLKLWDVWKPPK